MYEYRRKSLFFQQGKNVLLSVLKKAFQKYFFHPSICIWKSSTVLQLGRWVQDNEICIHADQHKKISSSKIGIVFERFLFFRSKVI